MSGYSATKKMYKASKPIDGPNFLTATPCGVCPVINQCSEDGLITPSTCIYMTQWLDMPTDEGGIDTSW